MTRWLPFVLVLLGGCADRPLDTDGPEVSSSEHKRGCTGSAPYCVDFCGSDWFQAKASCEDDDWACPSGLKRVDQCSPNTCWGAPASEAEVCTDQGWTCQPNEDTYKRCPGFICPECTGFDGPITQHDCTCACEDGQVYCRPLGG